MQVKRYNNNTGLGLLLIDYEFDAVGNIRASKVATNYEGYHPERHDDYFVYDANNRVLINKGQLRQGRIEMSAEQGNLLTYDASGNITYAEKYEGKTLAKYAYEYTLDNLVVRVTKNGKNVQTKEYNKAGQVVKEHLFDIHGVVVQHNSQVYLYGQLDHQLVTNKEGEEKSRTLYTYDKVGNVVTLVNKGAHKGKFTYTQTHTYKFVLWEGYQQEEDKVTFEEPKKGTTYGRSTHEYDVNGQLNKVIDKKKDDDGVNHTTEYFTSSIDGIRGKRDQQGETRYLNVAGKTIGDLHLDKKNKQHLEVYAGFTPAGTPARPRLIKDMQEAHPYWSQESQEKFFKTEAGIAMKKLQAGTPPDSPQNNLGTYTLQAGDTLEQIALQVYGDSSLWYLIADANGITERSAQAGEQGGQMHVGQQIHLPATSLTHNSHATHKVFTRNDWEGDTSASAPLAPPPRQHNLLFKRIVIGVVMTVATVATAGIFGMLSGAVAGFSGLSGILGAGLSLLSGGAALAPSLAFGFTAGFVGSIASQLTAMAFKMQEGIDYKGAVISGLSTAATASLGGVLGKTKWVKALDEKLPLKELFSVKDAVNMMERDALNQSINMAIRHHQCFNWTELAAQGITAGILGGTFGKAVNDGLKSLEPTGILAAEANALVTGGADSLAGGNHFDAGKILANNLGNAVGNTVVDVGAGGWKSTLEWFEHHKLMRKQELEMQQKFKELSHDSISRWLADKNFRPREIWLNTKVPEFERFQAEVAADAYDNNSESKYSPIPKEEEGAYCPIPIMLLAPIVEIFCDIDDFCNSYDEGAASSIPKQRAYQTSNEEKKEATSTTWIPSLDMLKNHQFLRNLHTQVNEQFAQLNLEAAGLSLDLKANKSSPLENSKDTKKNFTLTDALEIPEEGLSVHLRGYGWVFEKGLKKVYDKYGAEMSKIVEMMYRVETTHFTSGQYVLTGTSGMETHSNY